MTRIIAALARLDVDMLVAGAIVAVCLVGLTGLIAFHFNPPRVVTSLYDCSPYLCDVGTDGESLP